MTAPGSSSAQFVPTSSKRRRWPWLLIGLLLGAMAGAGAAYWLLDGGDPAGDDDAAAACAILDRLDHTRAGEDGPDGLAAAYQWSAAQLLADAAAQLDDEYTGLAEAMEESRVAWQQSFDPAAGTDALERAEQICDDL